ncbi:MAG: pantoate--beta-alanine ligase, partial [Proteobacteria bacterium]|nr:pantoate--beta-alanine ligase [Pseudomonadota bacterium]
MRQLKSISELREQLNTVRKADKKIILVPTMGNLHDGHLSLVKRAQKIDGLIVTTIFVNPTQFVAGEDFDSYPRTLENDLSLLEQLNPDIVFIPDTNEIYPDSQIKAEIIVPELDSIYCGEYRPGHFRGVATVVTKLFNIVQPDIAIFGEKDYQQLLVIRSLVQSLD